MVLLVHPAMAVGGERPTPSKQDEIDRENPIRRLVAQLGSAVWKDRERASYELAFLGEEAVPFLEEALESDDLEIRVRAEDILRKIMHPSLPDKKIDGVITGFSRKVNLLVIDVGTEDGVKVGMEFSVIREGKVIGRIEVEVACYRHSACRTVAEPKKGKFAEKDRVTSQPCARVIEVGEAGETAVIDMGRRDGLRPGIRFTFFTAILDGVCLAKGSARVLRVDRTTSRVSFLRTYGNVGPLEVGNFAWNPAFVPGKPLVFLPLGKSYEEGIVKSLEDAGHIPAEEVRDDLAYAVLVSDGRKDTRYDFVESRGVPCLQPRELEVLLKRMKDEK
jgi:hypothetical protein